MISHEGALGSSCQAKHTIHGTFRQVIKKHVGRLATDRCSTQRPHGPLCRCETSAEQFVKEDKVLH
jgi:hypothetical protein